MASFIRKVPTASGARAVQIVHKQGREVVGIDPLRTVTIDIDSHTITAKPQLNQDAEQILAKLPPVTG